MAWGFNVKGEAIFKNGLRYDVKYDVKKVTGSVPLTVPITFPANVHT